MSERDDAARATLRGNDRGGYTVPTARLYPFQWNWDSAFVAMGWATFDEARAWDEILLLLRGQWADGMIPQIVFHAPSEDYFPGPDVWQTGRTPETSGITQPPVLATAARYLWAQARDAAAARADGDDLSGPAAQPSLVAGGARAEGDGAGRDVAPWETGMDNSPAWDTALERVPSETVTPIRRRDTAHIDPSMRPRGIEYQRFIHLVDTFRAAGWQPARLLAASPFRVPDIGTNAILLRAERDLLALAHEFGSAADTDGIAARIATAETAIAGLWNPARGLFTSRDLVYGTAIDVATSAGFLPLYAHAATDEQAAAMAATLRRWADCVRFLVPSTDPADPHFEPVRYWRGPVWSVVNWMIADGFAPAGATALARRIRDDMRELVAGAGLSEYFDPNDGSGAGGGAFSWTAAIDLLLA